MSTKLPPSERDLEIYDAIHIDDSSTRYQAQKHGISQTRVRQIIRRVVEWLGEVLPPQTKVAKEQETHLARQIAADRFQRQFEHVNELWKTTLESKFASIRIRLTTAQARLGVVGGLIDGLAADAIEGLPVPTWTSIREGEAPAEPSAVGRGSPDPAPTHNPLFPPPGYIPKHRPGPIKEMPQVLWDPLYEHEITPEVVAARAAWGKPISPDWIKRLQAQGKYPRDDTPAESDAPHSSSPTPPLSPSPPPSAHSAFRTPHSALPPPPPLRDCSPKNDKAPESAAVPPASEVENHDSTWSCDADTPDQNVPANVQYAPSQPLLTTPNSPPVTQLELSPHQTGVTISPIAANNSLNPQNSQVASNSGG